FAFWIVLGIVAAVIICGVGVGMYLVRDLSSGIASIVTPMQALGSGDLSAEVRRRGEKTEIGAMADALQVFKDALIAKKAADEAAAHDAEAKIERGRRVDGITRDFENMIVETVSSASTELEASASTLTATAERAQELAIRSPRLRKRLPPMCSRWRQRRRKWHPRSTRSAGRCRNPRGWPATPWGRPREPTIGSVNCRRPPPASAT